MGIPYFIVGDAGGRFSDLTSDNPSPAGYKFGETRQLGYLKVFVDPANKTATAQEIFVASVKEDDSNETPEVHNPPVIADTVTFPLNSKGSPGSIAGVTTGKPSITTPAAASFFTGTSGVGSSFVVIITGIIGISLIFGLIRVMHRRDCRRKDK